MCGLQSTSPHQSITNGTAVTPPTPIIFTTRIVSQPKKLGDKKSHFLKQLKMGSDENGVGESDTMKTDKKQEDSNSMDGVSTMLRCVTKTYCSFIKKSVGKLYCMICNE